DSRSADTIIQLFEQFVAQGKTIAMVTHDPSLTSRTHRNIIISDGELIDESVSRALPQLRHRHMLEFTKLLEERAYHPRQTIFSRDMRDDHFFIIRKGEVEVALRDEQNKEYALSNLRKHEFFGMAELTGGGRTVANVRAGKDPVEVVVIPRADFVRVMDESPITADAVGRIVQTKLETQRIADHRAEKA
ncbi:MAG: cyclic nucleotide-binding domain-containing protein, partial [Anaerolineales bacterium]|nr:cyclic nucleotide-binding domain-containing protein [Anaerolineales bacterium]